MSFANAVYATVYQTIGLTLFAIVVVATIVVVVLVVGPTVVEVLVVGRDVEAAASSPEPSEPPQAATRSTARACVRT